MAFSYSPKIVTDGLVLYLDAANPYSYVSGSTVWNDLSRNSISTIVTGSSFPAYSTESNGVLVFNTTPLSAGNSSVLNLTDLTLSVWIKTTYTLNQVLIGKNYLTSYFLNIAPGVNSFSLWTAGTELQANNLTTLGNGNWHNITATMTGTTKTLYYDSLRVNTGTGTPPGVDTYNLVIGNSSTYTAFFSGSMSSAIVYNRALTQDEVLQNYNATKGRFGLK